MARENRRSGQLLTSIASVALPPFLRWLGGTWSIHVINLELVRRALGGGYPIIGGMWHQNLPTFLYFFRDTQAVAMVSRSRDGEVGARVARRLGVDSARGSSSEGGREALHVLVERAQEGRHIAFIADGPKGPAREAKLGLVVAAARSGRPIIPIGAWAKRVITARSWDHTRIPLPYSRVVVALGDPIFVDRDLPRERYEEVRLRAQAEINRMEATARAAL